ncbi:hypothetical protein [Streptomyces sp. NPDC051577]|uniref:hypothetical protein n=1 Tax=Streptomyces sp. NPDC051577 TaxID=3155166 RepID=UPI00344AC45D
MNTTALKSLADLICRQQTKDRTPMGIAFAIESAGRHMTPETAAEMQRLTDRVAELSVAPHATVFVAEFEGVETEVHSTLDGARACCDDIAKAVSNGQCWDWSLGDGVHVQHWTHVDDDRPTGATGGTVTEVRVQYPEGAERVDELVRLRARVSELETERHSTNEALSDAAVALRASRDRIAELETARSRPAPMLLTAAPSCTAPNSPSCSCADGEYRFCGADLGRSEYPFTCSRRVAHKGRCSGEPDPGLLEEPHDSPLHQFYRLGRDLPEVPRG